MRVEHNGSEANCFAATPAMSDTPSYLGMLAVIAIGESRTYETLSAWRDTTEDTGLAAVLDMVATREHEHAVAFTERLGELGFSLDQSPSTTAIIDALAGMVLGPLYEDARLAVARSSATDAEKFRRLLDFGAESEAAPPDPLAGMFDDPTIDAETAALLGRFIAEERDSVRRLRAELRRIEPSEEKTPRAEDANTPLSDLASCIDRLSRILEDLKQARL